MAYAAWAVVTLLALVMVRRLVELDAKVGPTAPWADDESLKAAFQKASSNATVQGGTAVRVLARHTKRLKSFVIDSIVHRDLRNYELSNAEERALRGLLLEGTSGKASDLNPLFRHGAQLVRFANRSALWDITKPKELLSSPHLTQFMQWYQREVTEDVYNEARKTLVKAGGQVFPDKVFRDVPEGTRQQWSEPTPEEDLEAQWNQAVDYPSVPIRRVLLAVICLCRGAGLRAKDLRLVHGVDVIRRPRGRTVVRVVRRRGTVEVVVLNRFAPVLRELASISGQRLLLEALPAGRGVMEPARALAKSWDRARAPFPCPDELANAYFLEMAQRPVRVSRFFTLLAGSTLRGLEDLHPYMEESPSGPEDDVEGFVDIGIPYFTPNPTDVR